MIKALALLTMFGSALGVIIVSSVLLAFSTNNLPLTLFVVGIEITAFFEHSFQTSFEYKFNFNIFEKHFLPPRRGIFCKKRSL